MKASGDRSTMEMALEALQTVFLVLVWYTVNIGLMISNKWLISETGFHSTSFLTLLHMLTSTAASGLLLLGGVVPGRRLNRRLALKVAVLAGSFTVSVATCMASLEYLPASFVQAIGSTTPGFTAALALLVQGRLEARLTYGALVPVAGGIALASGGEPLFNALGLGLQLVACASRSLKTVLQAVLLTDDTERFHTMTLLAYTSAFSAAMLAPLAALTEPGALALASQLRSGNPSFLPLLGLNCALAFLANWTNFIISKRLGALTLQVLGNFKNVVAAVTALMVFRNPFTSLGIAGYVITATGVFTYSHLVVKHPARWIPPPIARLLGDAWGGYRPLVGDADKALPCKRNGGGDGGSSAGEGGAEDGEGAEAALREPLVEGKAAP